MSKIFVSHSSRDQESIEKFCHLLKVNSYVPWYSGDEITTAQFWDEEVTRAIVNSDFLICFLTESVNSKPDQVRKELLYAQDLSKHLIIYEIGDIANHEEIKKIYNNLNRIQRTHFDSFDELIDKFDTQVLEDLKKLYQRLIPTEDKLRDLTTKVKKDFEELDFFKGKFTLYSIQSTLPEPIHKGEWPFDNIQMNEYERQVLKYEEEDKTNKDLTNEPHALMRFDEKYYAKADFKGIDKLSYYSTNYIGVRTLRNLGYKPKIISAGAITISTVEKKLYFQQRGDKVATYKDHFHIMGGNYIGKPNDGLRVTTSKVDKRLSYTIFREIFEESSISISPRDCETGIYSIGIEDDTGFIQVEAHAINLLSKEDLIEGRHKVEIDANWEGGIYGVGFDSLEDFLKYTYKWWVPSGFAHVMIWLALDAPFAPTLDGEDIYESVLEHIRKQEKM